MVRNQTVEKPMDDLANDLLRGVGAISAFTGLPKRAVYHLAETKRLPLFKMDGRIWCGRKSTLRKHIDNLEASQKASA